MPLFTKPQFNSVWASSGSKLTPDSSKISQGWIVEIPPHEFENWSQNRQDALLAHINQVGIPMWDATVEYQAGKSYIQGSTTGNVYRAVTTNTNVNPELDIQGNWVIAFEAQGAALLKSQNLADVPDKALARSNLGIPDTVFYDGRYLQRANNLSDLLNIASARSNLGLGNSATRNIGTISGTVAAGDDSRIINAVPNSRTITAGAGLVGGGNLSSDRSISLGTPATIGKITTNYSSGTTHSHFFDMDSYFNDRSLTTPGYQVFPGGFKMVWGFLPVISDGASTTVTFGSPFTSTCFLVLPVGDQITINANAGHFSVTDINRFGCTVYWNATSNSPTAGRWLAIGI